MECRLFEIMIQKYYDGELSLSERARYENHRAQCERCRKLDADYALVFEGLGDMEIYHPSADFDKRVLAAVDISRYRASVMGRILRRIEFVWQRVPSFARITGVLVVFFIIFLTVFRPLLNVTLQWSERFVNILGSAIVAIQKLAERGPVIVSHLISIESYRAAGETLLDVASRLIAESPVFIVAILSVVLLVILFLIVGRTRLTGKKGENHVSIF
jgi:hypothetical protein